MEYWEHIVKHLTGEISEQETEQLNVWLTEDVKNQQLFDELKSTWKASGNINFNPDKDAAWKKINQRIEKQTKPQLKWLIRIAAVFVLGISTWSYFHFHQNTTTIIATNGLKEITLPDGSQISLNKGSSIEYENLLNEAERKVTLRGEAFFEIAKDKKHPFIVNCKTFKIKVLGTSFNINTQSQHNKGEVTVLTGIVLMSTANSQLKLTANESAFLNTNNQLQKTIFNTNSLAWKTGKLTFKNASLKEVAKAISKQYHVSIQLKKKALENCSFTGEFDNTTPLNDLFLIIEKAVNIESSQIDKQNFVWNGKGC